MRLSRLPIPAAPARQETIASYIARLATVHGMHPRELWNLISTTRPGTARRDVVADLLAAITGRPHEHLARALPEVRDPAPNWMAWRHQPQPRCPRCDARHDGGPVVRLLPHHRYVCSQHQYWIGPPDAGQPATRLGVELEAVIRAQRQHVRLLRRHGSAAAFDAVLTGFLICGHMWSGPPHSDDDVWHQWTHRAEILIPPGSEATEYSASRLFAAIYPEAVALAALIACPAWRQLAAGTADQQRQFIAEIGRRLGRPNYQPPEHGDAVAHWMKFDSTQPPSRPTKLFPDTRTLDANRPAKTNEQSLARQERGAYWFARNRRGANLLLHHRHIQPVLARDWSPKMDGIDATIWASQSTHVL
jgi:hypothetical protein